MITIFGSLIVGVFLLTLISMASGFWRMRGMTNKVFTLVEQEMERKVRENTLKSAGVPPDPTVCSHCGGRVATELQQCPNCGAGLS